MHAMRLQYLIVVFLFLVFFLYMSYISSRWRETRLQMPKQTVMTEGLLASSSSSTSVHTSDCIQTSFADSVLQYHNSRKQVDGTRIRVLVTGAAGFIGSHVADFCQISLGFDVIGVDNLSGGFESNTEAFVSAGGVFVVGDLQDTNVVDDIFAKYGPFDHIFHLAAYAAEGLSHFVRHFNYVNNLGATVLLINAAVRQEPPVKTIVFTSSIAAYGASDGNLPLTETSPQRPEDPYGIAKHAAELDLKAAFEMFGLNFIIFRPHNVYGPRQNIADKFRNAIGIFMNQILRAEPITIFGDGTQRRAFSYIDDVAPLIAASPIFPQAMNQDFFVGVDKHYSILELSDAVQMAMNIKTNVNFLHARKEVEFAYASHSKLRCVFNPSTPVSLQEGLRKTAMFVKSRGAFVPTGYEAIEVCKGLPPSWHAWFKLSDPEVQERKCGRRHIMPRSYKTWLWDPQFTTQKNMLPDTASPDSARLSLMHSNVGSHNSSKFRERNQHAGNLNNQKYLHRSLKWDIRPSLPPYQVTFHSCPADHTTKSAGFRVSNLAPLSVVRVRDEANNKLLTIGCMVYTCKKNRQRFLDQLQTWLSRCDHIFAFSDEEWSVPEYNITTIMVQPDPARERNMWGRLKIMWSRINLMWCSPPTTRHNVPTQNHCARFDLLLVCGDDTYVVVENMRSQLTEVFGTSVTGREIYAGEPFPFPSPWLKKKTKDPYVTELGTFMYNSGAGYFVSWETMQRIILCTDNRNWWGEDVSTAKCLLSTGSSKLYPQRLNDSLNRPLVLWDLDERDVSRASPYVFERTGVSPDTFVFHGVSHDSLFRLHNMFYKSLYKKQVYRKCA